MDANLWNDGRSGEAGCAAGNLVLADLAQGGIAFRKVRGTTFESPESIWIGRVCATDSYLSPGVAHWANISFDQHRELMADAASNQRSLVYLFITAMESPPSVHYWRVPGEIIDRLLTEQGKAHRGGVYGMHIVEAHGRYRIGQHDVSEYHRAVSMNERASTKLAGGFEAVRRRRTSAAAASSGDGGGRALVSATTGNPDDHREFTIHLAGGRNARVLLPIPIAENDLPRLKGWFDLMSDVLLARAT
jgi:hypothetical protein